MNVAISTFVRRGYPLTALAVAVLLAGFSGTAWAQTTGVSTTATSRFKGSSGTLPEGAATTPLSKPRPLEVTITRTTKSANDPYNTSDNPSVGPDGGPHLIINFEYDGDPGLPAGVTVKADASPLNNGGLLTFDRTDPVKTREEKTGLKIVDPNDSTKMIDELHTVTIAKSEIVLTIEDGRADDADWLTEKFVMTVSKHPTGLGAASKSVGTTQNPYVNDFTSSKFTVNIDDDDPQPVFKFNDTNILLAEGSEQTVMVGVGTGADGAGTLPPGILGATNDGGLLDLSGVGVDSVLLFVSPADALGPTNDDDDADDDDDRGIISIQVVGAGDGGGDLDLYSLADAEDRYDIGVISGAATGTGINLKITAKDVAGFRDEQVTLTLMDGRTEAKAKDDGGGIDDSPPAMVTVLSSKAPPTVAFSTESISIDEGDSETVFLLASGMQGDEVGAVGVAVRGDADISLEQNGSPVGSTVSFGGNANAELTIIANFDPSLETGEEKTATVTITDANGALTGDPNTVTVTVVGLTGVPVLPLLGQLLLALLLMAGGARLYPRRRQQ